MTEEEAEPVPLGVRVEEAELVLLGVSLEEAVMVAVMEGSAPVDNEGV